jgi:hypothetical protein
MGRENYLLSKIPKGLDYNSKYEANFEKYARYMGNGVYSWKGIHATDTRILFLTGVLMSEKVVFKQE